MTLETDWSAFQPLDPGRIVGELARHEVLYVVIGGYAAVAHGLPWSTDDLDICPESSTANLRRLAAALSSLDARLRAQGVSPAGIRIKLDEKTWKLTPSMTFTTVAGPFDVNLRPDGTSGYPDLVRKSVLRDLGGQLAPIAALEDVARSKEAAGRPKDLERLPDILRALKKGRT